MQNSKHNPQEIEQKWQKKWEKDKLFKTPSRSSAKKFYILDMFPYPSAEGLHVGHFKGYTATDVISRYLRMKGFNVLHPIGWDAFGLPAENYAIKTGVHPAVSTARNIARIKQQMIQAGFSYDWSREINTTDPAYYKWTQWIFLKMFEKGLAYEAQVPINFCPSCKTGLANEEVVGGACERCGTKVIKKELRQWILKITAYAERLLQDLEGLDWPAPILEMQKNWIGKSEGAIVKFPISNTKFQIEVFTTRPDTLFGATFMVLAPEHPLIWQLKPQIANWKVVEKYVLEAAQKSDLERQESKVKSGVKLEGVKAINPVNNQLIPVFTADYVLSTYGTGAIMAVPAHDSRDFEFAKKFKLPIIQVVKTSLKLKTKNLKLTEAYEGEGVLVNSGQFSGLDSQSAKEKITKFLQKKKLGKKAISYKLRDWIFSRQRYWGEPIPLIFCKNCAARIKSQKTRDKIKEYSQGELLNPGWIAIPEKDLPLKLPEVKRYQPTGTGESPLAAISSWVNTKCPKCGGVARRETNTMPQWAGSCWYHLRFIDPKNNKKLVDSKLEKYWMGSSKRPDDKKLTSPRASSAEAAAKAEQGYGGVNWYVGGAEHAVLHLLYARFWHKFLFDLGIVSTEEPFLKLRNVGLVLGPDNSKMSKSRGNVITPDEIIAKYGADTLRLYEGFMGPFEQIIAWDPASVEGVWRFLNKVWDLTKNVKSKTKSEKIQKSQELKIAINSLIKKVEEDILAMKFNTAIAAMMEFINLAKTEQKVLDSSIMKQFILLFAAFVPHIAEELWGKFGGKYSVHQQSWPKFDQNLIKLVEKTVVVQVDGKLRDKIMVVGEISNGELERKVLSLERVQKHITEKKIKKIIIVPNRLVNIVTMPN